MTDTEKRISQEFVANLDSIAYDFVRCFGLKHRQEIANLSDPLLRWIDFRLRYIDPNPRKVCFSKAFPKELLKETENALNYFCRLIEDGSDINPYQGKGLIKHHDISGQKRQHRTDLLWADWGILHFHLSDKPIPEGEYFSERSDWLLFAIVGDDFFAAIDIRHHEKEQFSDPDIIKIIAETWPEMMAKFEIRGVAPTDVLSEEEYAKLRRHGVSSFITIGDKVYAPPGMGLTTASTPLRVTFAIDRVRQYAREFACAVCERDSEFQTEMRSSSIKEPNFKLVITPRGIAVYESNINKAWLLPKKIAGTESHYLADLNHMVAPEWAVHRLLPYSETQ